MPRERTLSHGFFTNHLLASCSPIARLLFQGIWTVSDFDGCFAWDPPALAMKLLPRDTFNPSEAMDELERLGFIQSYEHNGGKFGFVVNWHKYQDPHPGERAVFPKPKDDPRFCVRIKAAKYRTKADLAFGQQEVGAGIIQYSQVANKLQVDGEQVVSKAFPSNLSCPSSPSLPTKETTTTAAPSAPLLPEVVNGKPHPKGRKSKKFDIPALAFTEEQEQSFERIWQGWPSQGWNFTAKAGQPRRINKALAMRRFKEILDNFPRKIDGGPITADHLVDSALAFIAKRKAESPGAIPNVPCIANFFSSEEVSKKPWQDALMEFFGETV